MYVLGGETDAQTRMKDCNKCSRHWAHIVWKLSLHNWQWHRIEPQVRMPVCTATPRVHTNLAFLENTEYRLRAGTRFLCPEIQLPTRTEALLTEYCSTPLHSGATAGSSTTRFAFCSEV